MTNHPNEHAAAIADLLTEFCWRVDNGAGDTVAELFAEDATVDTPHFNLSGKSAVHDWFSARAKAGNRLSRHFWSNMRITSIGADRYRVQCNAMTLVGAPPAPSNGARVAAGSSEDEVLFVDGRALFASRKLDVIFEGAISAQEPAA